MSDFKVIDKAGTWVTNVSEFPMPNYTKQAEDPSSPMQMIEPGVPTKIIMNDFLRAQPSLQILTEDPITGEPIKVKVEPTPEPVAESEPAPEQSSTAMPATKHEGDLTVNTGKKK